MKYLSFRSLPCVAAWMTLAFATHAGFPQEPGWWTELKAKCGMSPSMAYNDWVAQGSPCNKSNSAPSTPTASSSAGQAFINGFKTGLMNVQRQQANLLSAIKSANAATDAASATKAHADEQDENAIMAADLARHQAQAAGQGMTGADFSNEYKSANRLLSGGLTSLQLPGMSASGQSGSAQQKAWRQLHCMAYLSSFAFEDLALGDIADYHDIRYDASQAADGSSTSRACPQAPDFPNSQAQSSSVLDGATKRLRSDLDEADQIAARLQQANYHPAAPGNAVPASDPQLAALVKQQQALNAVQSAKNPYSDSQQFAQFEKDRRSLAKDIEDSANFQKDDFGSIHVNLGSVPAPANAVPPAEQ